MVARYHGRHPIGEVTAVIDFDIDTDYLKDILIPLLETPSPTGWADAALQLVEGELRQLGLQGHRTRKGTLVSTWQGQAEDAPRALTAHVDTLGAVVKRIKDNGRLELSPLGGFAWNTVEGEGCHVFTEAGHAVSGSLLPVKASAHIFGSGVAEMERTAANMEVRLDERTATSGETRDLGIEVGDFVSFDPRTVVTPNGFIRSRHLDDKAGVACILAAINALREAQAIPSQRTRIHISHYEEVGHGAAAGFPEDLAELVAVDMAVVGEGQTSDEFHVTLCAKDRGGPYHAGLTRRLKDLSREAEIPFMVDIYPQYGSDGEAYWRSGGDVAVALIGPGVDASHSYERTHVDALVSTARLIAAYLTS
jgi:putative aminopeptidase FrvX